MAISTTLVNLTGKPVFLVADGVLVRLPEAPPPQVVETQSETLRDVIITQVGSLEARIREVDMVGSLISAPPTLDSVLWLVKPVVIAQFPDREDFIRPAAYKLTSLDKIDCSTIDVLVLKDAQRMPGFVMALVSVSRSPLVASGNATQLDDV